MRYNTGELKILNKLLNLMRLFDKLLEFLNFKNKLATGLK